MVKQYAPSATQDFGMCQVLWTLKKLGWHQDYIGYPNIAMSVGTGVHKGAELVHEHHKDGSLEDLREDDLGVKCVIDTANHEATEGIRRLIAKGAHPIEKVDDWETRITDQVTRGTMAYINQFEGWFEHGWEVVSTEEAYGANRGQGEYTGRLDLLFKDDFGLAVGDVKTKQVFKSAYYKDMFVREFRYNWQMYSYCHMVYKHTGEMPRNFYLIMVEMKQRPVVTAIPYPTDLEYYQRWLHAAEQRWQMMEEIEAGERVPAISDNHFFYGRSCEFKQACLELGLNEQLMVNSGLLQIDVGG